MKVADVNLDVLVKDYADLLTHRQALSAEVLKLKTDLDDCEKGLRGVRMILVALLEMNGHKLFIPNAIINQVGEQVTAGMIMWEIQSAVTPSGFVLTGGLTSRKEMQ